METTVALPSLDARVRLFKAENGQSTLMGFADVVIGGAFVIRGIRIVMSKPTEGREGGLFISFPSRKGTGEQQDKYFEVAHPITAEARSAVRELVLREYAEACGKAGA
jgi:stage V sporulation protein G